MNQNEVLRKQIQYYSYVYGAIGLLLFGQLMGNNGVAYLAIGMETMGLFMILLGEHIADVYGKMIRFRRKRNQYADVVMLKKRVLILQMILGCVCFLLTFLLADVIAKLVFKVPNAALIIRVLSPVLLLRTMITLLTGYLQSFGAHMPVAFTGLLRQVLFVILGKLFCSKFYAYGEKVAALLKNEDMKGMYGAVGAALAIVISEVVILAAFFIFYMMSDRNYDKKKSDEGLQKAENLRATLLNFSQMNARGMGLVFFKRFFILAALILMVQLEDMGVFYGKYLVICGIPLLLIGARYYLLYARLLGAIKNQNSRRIRENMRVGIQYAWSVSILVAVLIAVLAPQLVNTYFPADTVLQTMLQQGCVLIIAVAMLAYFVLIHMAHNKQMICLFTLLGSGILFVILGGLLGGKVESLPLAIIYAGEIALGVAAMVLGILTASQYRLQLEYVPVFVLPLVCVGVSGVIILLLSKFLTPHIGNGVCLWLGILLGIILYLVFLGICRVFSENEIEQIYGKYGKKLLSVIFK